MAWLIGEPPSPKDVGPDWYKWFKDMFFQSQSPTFLAYRSANLTGLGTGAYHVVQFNQETYDSHNFYDSVTTWRFQPQIPGHYFLGTNLRWSWTAAATNDLYICGLYLNNAAFIARSVYYTVNGQNTSAMHAQTIQYMNGSTDYVEALAYQASGANKDLVGNSYDCQFFGYRIGG